MLLQPCDWLENDANFKYVVDVFGRLDDDRVAKVRLTGFQPYFYLRSADSETSQMVVSAIETAWGKPMRGLKISQEFKLDAMRGFSGLKAIKVWKLTFPAIWMFKTALKTLKDSMKIGDRKIRLEDIYEANLPPFIRLFHELDIAPASPISFEAEEEEADDDENVDVSFTVDYQEVTPEPSAKIPLYAAAYDIETYSGSGNFPVSSNPEDEIIQIGVSFR